MSWHRYRLFGGHRLLWALLASAFTLSASLTARADQIDGDWCFPGDGRHLFIEGDDIVTPHGTATTGEYTRHAFRYVVPESDPGAGDEISMRQLNDLTMVLRRPDGVEETWKRCDLQVS